MWAAPGCPKLPGQGPPVVAGQALPLAELPTAPPPATLCVLRCLSSNLVCLLPPPRAQDVAPREASVLFHMGKIYKRLDMLDEAMACFASALDLQPPSADTNLIKSAGKGPAAPAQGRAACLCPGLYRRQGDGHPAAPTLFAAGALPCLPWTCPTTAAPRPTHPAPHRYTCYRTPPHL